MDVSKDTLQNPFKRSRISQDPDYDEAAPPDEKRLKYLEDQARSELTEKVKRILNKQFEIEVNRQQSEIEEIENSIVKVQQNLLMLRYVATRSFYSKGNAGGSQQPTIHPAVKQLIGKRPKSTEETVTSAPNKEENCNLPTSEKLKVPRYIPPNIPETIVQGPIRGERHCAKKKLVVGNVSRWIPIAERDGNASHRWMVYVRGPKEEPNISSFVSQVTFFLHPTYAPHDVIEVRSHPFHVTRRGWGEFSLRVQVQFHNPLCKPVNIVHQLKLDQSYTGLQTLGAETIVDVMVHTEEFNIPNIDSMLPIKAETEEAETEPEHVEPEPEHVEPEPEHATNSIPFIKTEPEDAKLDLNQVECPIDVSHIKPDPDATDVENSPSNSSDVDMKDLTCPLSDPSNIPMKELPLKVKLEDPTPASSSSSIQIESPNAQIQSLRLLSHKIPGLRPGNISTLNKSNLIIPSNPEKMLSIMRELKKIKTGDISTNTSTSTTTRVATPIATTSTKIVTKFKPGDTSTANATTAVNTIGRPTVKMPTYITLRKPDGTLTSAKVVGSPIYLKSLQQRHQVKPGESLLCTERIKAQQQQMVVPRIAMPIKTTVLTTAGLSAAGLTAAGLTAAGLTATGLTATGLTAAGLTAAGLITDAPATSGLTAGSGVTLAGSGSLLKVIKPEVKKNTGHCRVADSLFMEEMRLYNRLVVSVKSIKWRCRRDCIRYLANVFKLIDLRATDPSYRCCRPYTAVSLDVYRSWNVGKQRGAEWTRAKSMADIMSQCRFDDAEDAVWSTKKIMIWYRRHGYSDFQSWILKAPVEESAILASTLTEARIDNSQNVVDDVVIDVESLDETKPCRSPSGNFSLSSKKVVTLEDADPELTSHIIESIEQLGFKLGVDVLDVDSAAPLSRIIFSCLWKKMAEDLIRLSLNESWLRAKGGKPETISLADVLQAIQQRPEYDILTNEGLGVEAK